MKGMQKINSSIKIFNYLIDIFNIYRYNTYKNETNI